MQMALYGYSSSVLSRLITMCFPMLNYPCGGGGTPGRLNTTSESNELIIARQFTGKERDAETGLDFFGARYFSGPHGRFTSPDPKIGSRRHLRNPQKWNKYAYVLNNPLKYVDPDGLEELKVTIKTAIPYATTWLGGTYVDGYRHTANGQAVTFVQDAKNPLAPAPDFLTPGVTANLDIEFDEDANWISVTGTTSQFPSFDITVTRDNGNTVPIYHRDPWFNSTLLLFLPHMVDTGRIPLKRVDLQQSQKEHKNCLLNRDGSCVQ